MNDLTDEQEPKFWLHVPIETMHGLLLENPGGAPLRILDRVARLYSRKPGHVDGATVDRSVICHWLIFDPVTEMEAVTLLDNLSARVLVVAMRRRMLIRVAQGPPYRVPPEHRGAYNGPGPALISENVKPEPAWAEGFMTRKELAQYIFGDLLDSCQPLRDDRIKAAYELAVASSYDTLPRSIFLSQLTILDSLATRDRRPDNVVAWLDDIIVEANGFKDEGLLSAIRNLKDGSHGAAVRALVWRAATAMGEDAPRVSARVRSASNLYDTRSKLSHVGGGPLAPSDSEMARELASFVLDAALIHPNILL
jgi:hypothetical protein